MRRSAMRMLTSDNEQDTTFLASNTFETNLFDPATVRMGDIVAGMRVISVTGVNKEGPATAENYHVAFAGQAAIAGTFHYSMNELWGDMTVFFAPLKSEYSKLPIIKNESEPLMFLIGVGDKNPLSLRGRKEIKGDVTLLLGDLSYDKGPAEAVSSATVVQVITK